MLFLSSDWHGTRARPEIRDEIRRCLRWLVTGPEHDDLIAASLGAAPQVGQIAALLRDRVDALLA
jgi:hypothetical protein